GLQQRILDLRGTPVLAQDAEDGADAAGDVEVRGTVERIEHHAVACLAVIGIAQDQRLLVLLGGDHGHALPAPEVADQDLVGDDVELLLRLALHVHLPGVAQHVLEAGAAHLCGDHLGGDRQRREYPGECTGGLGGSLLLLQDVRLDGDERADAGRSGFGGQGVHPTDYGPQRLSLPGMWNFGETELAALGLSLSVALRAVAINLLPAVLIAWLLTRRRFPG